MRLKVPFYLQTTKLNCGPVALKMALEYLGENYTINQMEEQTGIKEGKALSTLMLAVAARKFGFKIEFYTKFLGVNPENLKMDFYKKYGNLEEENSRQRIEKAGKSGINLHEQVLSLWKIMKNIKEDRIMILILDWNVIKGQEEKGFQGHFVPVVGYDNENIYVHNHGFHNTQAFMPIKKDLFEKARKAKGTDEDIVIIYRKEK